MNLYDWLLALHVLSGVVVIAALVVLWAIVLATRPGRELISVEDGNGIGSFAGILVAVGMTLALIFGVWLAFEVDAYSIWDPWIVAALALWLVAGLAGSRSGKAFTDESRPRRGEAIALQAVSSLLILSILVLMIWKPGA